MDSKGKRGPAYAAARMRERDGNAHNRCDRRSVGDPAAAMLKRKSVLSSVVGVLALSSGASAQVLGEQTTMLTAYVTEQATVALPNVASTVFFPSGRSAVSGSIGVKSHRGAEDRRNFRVTWSWVTPESGLNASPVASRQLSLPLSGNVEAIGSLSPKAADSAGSNAVRVKLESFEL